MAQLQARRQGSAVLIDSHPVNCLFSFNCSNRKQKVCSGGHPLSQDYLESAQQPVRTHDYVATFFVVLIMYIYLPFVLLSVCYSCAYPALCVFFTPWKNIGLLQTVLSLIYFSVLLIMLALLPSVLRFLRIADSVTFFSVTQVMPPDDFVEKVWRHLSCLFSLE